MDNQDYLNQPLEDEFLDLMKKPTNVARASIGKKIIEKVSTEKDVDERLNSTADKVIENALNDVEHEAQTDSIKVITAKETSYFEQHKRELRTGGIHEPTEMKRMERVVKTNKRWYNIYYILFLWWIIGINTFIDNAKPLQTTLKVIACIMSAIFLAAFVFGLVYAIKYIGMFF